MEQSARVRLIRNIGGDSEHLKSCAVKNCEVLECAIRVWILIWFYPIKGDTRMGNTGELALKVFGVLSVISRDLILINRIELPV